MAGVPPIPPKGPKLAGGRRVSQAKDAISAGDIRKRAALGRTAARRTSAFARRTAFGKGAWGQRTIRTGQGGSGGVRSAAAGRKMFRPSQTRKTKAGAMFQAGQFLKQSVRERMHNLLEASALQKLSKTRAEKMRAKTLVHRERVRLGQKSHSKRGRPRRVAENQISAASEFGKYTTSDLKTKEPEAPKPHPGFLKLLKIMIKQGKCNPKKFD